MDPYVVAMWQYALWGLVGAAANVGVVFLEASRRVKGWPWERPKGPGGGVYAVSILIQMGIATATTAALAAAAIVTNAFVALLVSVPLYLFVTRRTQPAILRQPVVAPPAPMQDMKGTAARTTT